MVKAESMMENPLYIRPGLLHLLFFSVLLLMLATAWPAPSMSYGSCTSTVAELEGPLLPTRV